MVFTGSRASNFIRKLEWLAIVLTVALLPIDRFPHLDTIPFRLGLISLILLVLTTSIRLLNIALARQWHEIKTYILYGLLFALPFFAYFISTTYAISQSHAMGAATIMLSITVRAFCFFVLARERADFWKILRRSIYVVTAIVVGYGFLQYFFDTWGASTSLTDLSRCCTSNSTYIFPRVHSTALEPLYFDHFLMIPLWLMMVDFYRSGFKKVRREKKWLFLATATLFLLTIARSANVAMIVVAILFLWGIRSRRGAREFSGWQLKQWAIALLISLGMVLMSGLAAMFIDKDAQYDTEGISSLGRFGSHAVDFNDGSSQTRYSLWPKAWDYFKEEPLNGVGADNSRIRLNLEEFQNGTEIKELQPFNNDALGLIVDLGFFGLAAFAPITIALTASLKRYYRKAWDHPAAAFGLAAIAMLVQGNFFHSLLLTRTWIIVALGLTVLVSAKQFKGPRAKAKK